MNDGDVLAASSGGLAAADEVSFLGSDQVHVVTSLYVLAAQLASAELRLRYGLA